MLLGRASERYSEFELQPSSFVAAVRKHPTLGDPSAFPSIEMDKQAVNHLTLVEVDRC
jgi:hypothetical protein